MKSFEYASPTKLEEAVALLSSNWGEAEILAGGTDLITSMKQQITAPKRVVSLKNITSLKGIRPDQNRLRIGATTTLDDLISHDAVKEHFPSLVTAAKNIAAPQILSVGTVGGDLCQRPRCWYFRNGHGLLAMRDGKSLIPNGDNRYHAIFGNQGPAYFVSPSSLGPCLVALGAILTATGPNGKTRNIPAAEFFRAPKSDAEREIALQPNEILTEIQIPIQGLRNGTYEVRHRHGLDWPYVTASVAYKVNQGKAADAQIVLGHVAPTPWAVPAAAKLLNGAELNEATATRCAQAAVEGAKPLSDNAYKVQLVKAAVKRAILAAHQKA